MLLCGADVPYLDLSGQRENRRKHPSGKSANRCATSDEYVGSCRDACQPYRSSKGPKSRRVPSTSTDSSRAPSLRTISRLRTLTLSRHCNHHSMAETGHSEKL